MVEDGATATRWRDRVRSKGPDPDAWITEHSAAAVGHSGPVKHVLYLLCKEGLKQSTVGTPGLSLCPDSIQTTLSLRKLYVEII